MTIQSENRKSGPFHGNGRVSRFPFDFKVFSESDLSVTVRTGDSERNLLHGSDYEVSLQADQEMEPGGEVLLKKPLPDGVLLVITSAIPYLQLAKFTNQGGFYPVVLNDSLDRLTILTQQIFQQMKYMPRFGSTMNEEVDTRLPLPLPSHGIGWNETGTRLINTHYHIEAERSAEAAAGAANRSQASAAQAESAQAAAHQSAGDAQASASHAADSRAAAEDAASAAAKKADRVAGMAEEINQKIPAMQAHAEEAKRSAAETRTDSERARAAADLAQSLANSRAANLNSIKLGDGRNNNYQEFLLGNYQRTPGKGNYGAIFNGKQGGDHTRWMAIGTFGEDGNHISSLFADATKAYVRIGSTNHELAKAGDAIIYREGTKIDAALGYNRVVGVHDDGGGIPAGAYPYGVAISLAGGAARGQIYIAHTGEIWARGAYQDNTTHNWYRVDGADWANVRSKPTNLAGYGITDAACKVDMRGHIPGTSTPWQLALPNQIPEGIYEGLTYNANLQGGGVGVMRIVKAWGDGSGDYAIYREGTRPTGETYRQYSNNSMTAWRERIRIDGRALSGQIEQAAPPGTVMYFAGRNPPAGWLKANGAAVSRTTYAPLFAAIGTTYGSGDGRTTFNLPDLRGEFVRGWDDGRGVDSGRSLGAAQGHQMEYHAHFLANSQPGGQGNASGGLYSNTFVSAYGLHKAVNNNTANVGITSFNGGRENQDETRPRNVALLACIKI